MGLGFPAIKQSQKKLRGGSIINLDLADCGNGRYFYLPDKVGQHPFSCLLTNGILVMNQNMIRLYFI